MRRLVLPALALLTCIAPRIATAQAPPDGSAHRAAIDSLDFMVGRWVGDTWHEIGEFSRDGVNWSQTMEMNLRRER